MDFTYDNGLVALSIAVAMLGSFTGLVMTTGIQKARGAEVKIRILLGGFGIGGGIWSMHFISMLAVILPIPLSYDVMETAVSAVIAVVFTATALAIVSSRKFGSATLPLSALFLGSGIGGMHYLGMHAIRGSCIIFYSWIGVALSIAIAIQASAVALWFAFRQRGVLDTFLGSAVLGLAIASMHYTGMEATRFVRADGLAEALQMVFSENYLALAIAVTQYAVCGTCLVVFAALVFRPQVRQPGYADWPLYPALLERLSRERAEPRQGKNAPSAKTPRKRASALAFVQQRLVDSNRKQHDAIRWDGLA